MRYLYSNAESGGADGISRRRRSKTPDKGDRLSALPDSLIHHILSFLPSAKQAIQTVILSNRWRNQWTFVSNLIFDFSGLFFDYSPETESIPLTTSTICRIIDQTLVIHQCSKIQKFQIIADHFYEYEYDPNPEEKIRFVVRKQVEELILKFSDENEFRLPEFFFNQPALVKLQLSGCYMTHAGTVNWGSPKDLSIKDCFCNDEVITSIVSGAPLLQSLEIKHCSLLQSIISSKSLKRLVVFVVPGYVDILCPNLVELEIFLTQNEELDCASLDLIYDGGLPENSVKHILGSVQHLNELKLGGSFMMTLSALEMAGMSHPLLNNKSLTVKGSRFGPSFERINGIIFALRSSPMVERLVVKLRRYKYYSDGCLLSLDYSGENCWNSYGARFSSLVSHLRTVEITGFSQREDNPKLVLDFVEFLLKYAELLEKVSIVLRDCSADFRFEVSQKLLSFPRCSAATVELLCSH